MEGMLTNILAQGKFFKQLAFLTTSDNYMFDFQPCFCFVVIVFFISLFLMPSTLEEQVTEAMDKLVSKENYKRSFKNKDEQLFF